MLFRSFKLLFEAEKAGISIPKEVNEWWTLETIVDEHLNYEKQCSKLTT